MVAKLLDRIAPTAASSGSDKFPLVVLKPIVADGVDEVNNVCLFQQKVDKKGDFENLVSINHDSHVVSEGQCFVGDYLFVVEILFVEQLLV